MLHRFFGIRRLPSLGLALAAALSMTLLAVPGDAEAGSKKSKKSSKKASKSKKSAKKSKKTARSKKKASKAKHAKADRKRKRRKRRGKFRGHAAAKATLRTEPLPKASGNLWIYAENFREELKVNIFDAKGGFDDKVLADLDHLFRCKQTHEERAVDPRLYEVLSIISDHFEGKRIELVSAFRFQQNEGSRHYHASAMDIRIPGVSAKELYEYAESLDAGNMGIGLYPRSGFVHVDFRAPGDPSYRWTDTSPPGTGTKGGNPSRKWKRREPGS